MNFKGPRFVLECSGNDCGECTSLNGNGKWSLKGVGYTETECKEACKKNKNCNYASLSSTGQCHMSRLCGIKSGTGWTRYRRGNIKSHIQK